MTINNIDSSQLKYSSVAENVRNKICSFTMCKLSAVTYLFIYLFGVLLRFQHCTGHIKGASFVGRGNQYIQLIKVLYHNPSTFR